MNLFMFTGMLAELITFVPVLCLKASWHVFILDICLNSLTLLFNHCLQEHLKNLKYFYTDFLQKSLQYINVGVAVLSDEAATVQNFSVFSINNCKHSIVTLSSDNFLTCQNSYCQIIINPLTKGQQSYGKW